jgi:hypothetical protein
MKKFLIFVLFFSFLSIEPTLAAPQENKSCKVHKQTVIFKNKKFTCTKSSKGLRWSKGVALPISSKNPNSTPKTKDFTPWSTDFTSKELSDASQKNFISWININKQNITNNNFIVQEGTTGETVKILTKVNDLYSKVFGHYFKNGSTLAIGKDESWVVSNLNSSGWGVSSCNAQYSIIKLCLDHERFMGVVVPTNSLPYDTKNPGYDGGALIAHEYFHLFQGAITGRDSRHKIPLWFTEGTAEFVGYSLASQAMGATYWEGRKAMLSYSPKNYEANSNAISDYEIKIGERGKPTFMYPYNIGQMATEYIVASIGFQKMLDIWIDYSKTGNFEISFEKVSGISKEDFYGKFEKSRTNMGMPPTTWKLINNVNTKIK